MGENLSMHLEEHSLLENCLFPYEEKHITWSGKFPSRLKEDEIGFEPICQK